jgi:hypothetical protein
MKLLSLIVFSVDDIDVFSILIPHKILSLYVVNEQV